MTALLDYGVGNLRSAERALIAAGGDVRVQQNLRGATKIVLPGVGAFGAGAARLAPLAGELRAAAAGGTPILGICLGMQLLFELGRELGEHAGLGILAGDVIALPAAPGIKVPHVGWNELRYRRRDGIGLGGVDGEQAYFVHSYYARPAEPEDVAAVAEHGIEFPAAVQRGAVWGCQFHPEKSGETGLRILRAFLKC